MTTIIPDKPAWKSFTVWGGVILASAHAACAAGVIPPPWCAILESLGGLLALIGIRRAM